MSAAATVEATQALLIPLALALGERAARRPAGSERAARDGDGLAGRRLRASSPRVRACPPIDSSGVTHEFQFGDTCTAGAVPTSSGDEADWREKGVPPATVSLRVRGNLCLQNTTAEARVSVEAYEIDANGQHILLSRSNSLPSQGNGGSLNQFAVDVSTSRLTIAAFDHAHIQIQKRVNGLWQNVPGGVEVISYP